MNKTQSQAKSRSYRLIWLRDNSSELAVRFYAKTLFGATIGYESRYLVRSDQKKKEEKR